MHKLGSLLAWRTVDSFRVPCGLRSREPHLRRIAPTLTGLGERDDEAQELLAVMLLDADVARGARRTSDSRSGVRTSVGMRHTRSREPAARPTCSRES